MPSRCCTRGKSTSWTARVSSSPAFQEWDAKAKKGCQRGFRPCSKHFLHLDGLSCSVTSRARVQSTKHKQKNAIRCQACHTPKPCAPNLLRVHQLRFAEFACVSDAASEAPKRLLRRVQWAGAAVGVRGVALHLVKGQEVAAEGAAQAHGRVR